MITCKNLPNISEEALQAHHASWCNMFWAGIVFFCHFCETLINSIDVRAKFHGNSTFWAWVEAFCSKRSTLQTLGANRSQSGRSRHNLKDPFRVLPIEILCTKLRELWTKNGGVLSINVFWTHPPHGGARRAACEKCWAEVLNCYPGNVCAKCGFDRANGAGD